MTATGKIPKNYRVFQASKRLFLPTQLRNFASKFFLEVVWLMCYKSN